MSARPVLSALRTLSVSVLAFCAVAARAAGAVGTRTAQPSPERSGGQARGSAWLRLVIASLAACAALFSITRTAAAGEPITRAALEDDALALPACSLEPDHASFWAASAGLETAPVQPASAATPSGEAGDGCSDLLDDPLAPAPLCDPSATTGVAAAYVRSVADDRLEAGPGCGDGEFDAQGWLGEREPDPTSWQQSSLEPADLCELATPRAPSASVTLPESACPGRSADGISMNIERPPMRN